MVAGRRGEGGVPREQRGGKGLGQRDIGRIVCRYIVSELPDPGKEYVVRIAGQGQAKQIFEGLSAPSGIEVPPNRVAPEDLGDLEIDEVWGMKRFPCHEEAVGHPRCRRGVEKHFQDG